MSFLAPRDRLRRIAAAGAVVSVVAAALAGGVRAEGDRIVLQGLDGGQLSEADLSRGTVILVVWASWSPRCRDIVPRVNALGAEWSGSARVATVVFQEDASEVRTFLRGQELEAPVYLDADGTFAKKHAVTTLPSLLVFRDGETVFRGKLPPEPDPVIRRALG